MLYSKRSRFTLVLFIAYSAAALKVHTPYKNSGPKWPLKKWAVFISWWINLQASLRNCIHCVHCDDHLFIRIFGSVYYAVLSSTVLTFDQPLRRFLKATLISSCTYIAFWQNVHCALEDFLLNPGKTGRSCSFSRRKISRKNSGTRVRKNWCSRILCRLSYHWRLGNPITKLPPWNETWKIFKNSCYFRCRKRFLTAGSKFYLSRYCFFSRCKKEVERLLWVPWLASDSCFLFSCVP